MKEICTECEDEFHDILINLKNHEKSMPKSEIVDAIRASNNELINKILRMFNYDV